MTQSRGIHDKLDVQDYSAYTIGLAAELLGVQPAFLRSLDAAGLLTPVMTLCRRATPLQPRRTYPRPPGTYLLDQNMPLATAIRIITLEQQLALAHQRIATSSKPPANPQGPQRGAQSTRPTVNTVGIQRHITPTHERQHADRTNVILSVAAAFRNQDPSAGPSPTRGSPGPQHQCCRARVTDITGQQGSGG